MLRRMSWNEYMELLNNNVNNDKMDEFINEVEVYDEVDDEDESEVIEG